MAQEIYNEGRVVGLSAWEIFVKDAINRGIAPEDIPTEQEWLNAMLCKGHSTILKVVSGTTAGVHDYPLPTDSSLTAAGVILGSMFIGTCEWDTSNYAKKVTSYGPLINNISTSSPTSSSVPYNTASKPYETFKDSIVEFVKIYDGIVYTKKANWIQTPDGDPYKDIDPNFANSDSVVRLYLSETLNADVYILLSGFEDKTFLNGISQWATNDGGTSAGGSTDTRDNINNWTNGGMLGPQVIPWATKIILTVPSSAYTLSTNITRTIPSDTTYGDGEEIDIEGIKIHNYQDFRSNATAFIDFDSINLTDYYTVRSLTSSTLRERISDVNFGFTTSYNSMIAWYPGMSAAQINAAISAESNAKFFPPALYAVKVTAKNTQTLVPLDVAAPGTIKCFNTAEEAYNYTQILPNNFAVYYNSSNNTYSFVKKGDNNVNNWFSSAKVEYLTEPKAVIKTNSTTTKFIALNNSSGIDYGTTGAGGVLTNSDGSSRTLIWNDLLTALKDNKAINILGTRLTSFATELKTNNKIGVDTINNPIAEVGATKVTIAPGANAVSFTSTTNLTTKLATLGSGTSIKSGTNFIEFSNGLRLYISTSNPGNTNVPVGSIGIGW